MVRSFVKWLQHSSACPEPLGSGVVHVRNKRTVCEGLTDCRWVRDISHALTVQVLLQYLRIWDLLHNWHLNQSPDRFVWHWTALGEFSSASAYKALFLGRSHLLGAQQLRKSWRRVHVASLAGWFSMVVVGPPTIYGVMDLVIEMTAPYLTSCVHSQETWFCILRYVNLQMLIPQQECAFRKLVVKCKQRGVEV